jgi:hypothetical protein
MDAKFTSLELYKGYKPYSRVDPKYFTANEIEPSVIVNKEANEIIFTILDDTNPNGIRSKILANLNDNGVSIVIIGVSVMRGLGLFFTRTYLDGKRVHPRSNELKPYLSYIREAIAIPRRSRFGYIPRGLTFSLYKAIPRAYLAD